MSAGKINKFNINGDIFFVTMAYTSTLETKSNREILLTNNIKYVIIKLLFDIVFFLFK